MAQVVPHPVTVGDKAPAAVGVVPLPAPVGGQVGAGEVAQAVGMAPFVAGLVTPAVNQGADTIAAAEAMVNDAVLVPAPGMVVGDLLEHVGVALGHVAAGDAK